MPPTQGLQVTVAWGHGWKAPKHARIARWLKPPTYFTKKNTPVEHERLTIHFKNTGLWWVATIYIYILILLRGRPEISTFSTYEITSHKRGEGVAKNVDNLITFFSIFNVEQNAQTCVKMNVITCDGLPCWDPLKLTPPTEYHKLCSREKCRSHKQRGGGGQKVMRRYLISGKCR